LKKFDQQDKQGVMKTHSSHPQSAPFGALHPTVTLKRHIDWARSSSFSRPLYLLSSVLRKLALRSIGDQAVDYDFRGLNVRFRPKGNTAEKRALLNPARFDTQELAFIEQKLPRGGIFLDIGANAGLYGLVAAKAAGPDGRVLAFEPNPPVMERLAFNIANNPPETSRIAPIEAVAKAVTGQNGPVTFAPPARNLGEGRVLTGTQHEDGSFLVEGIKLADCLAEHGITRTDMMKIDIEGHEIHALGPFLKDAPASLHPRQIIIERGDDDHWQPLASLLQETGYGCVKSCHMNEIWEKHG
jgi:FkbM family methyltransferase